MNLYNHQPKSEDTIDLPLPPLQETQMIKACHLIETVVNCVNIDRRRQVVRKMKKMPMYIYQTVIFMLLVISIPMVNAQLNFIKTFAGTGVSGVGGENLGASSSPLSTPFNLWIDSQGYTYIAEYGNCRIRKVTPSTNIISTIAGIGCTSVPNRLIGDGGPATSAALYNPSAVWVATNGDFYITDTDNHRIRAVSGSTGILTTIGGSQVRGLSFGYSGDNGPATSATYTYTFGLAGDTSGNIYFTDNNAHRIRKITMSTTIVSTFAGNGVSGYNGDNLAATSTTLFYPTALATDSSSSILYFCDSNNYRIRKIVQISGVNTISTIAGSGVFDMVDGDGTYSSIKSCDSMYVDTNGDLYFVDYNSYRIRQISMYTYTVTTIAGTGSSGYPVLNSYATSTTIGSPRRITGDTLGNIYISDVSYSRIYRLSLVDTIVTPVTYTITVAIGTGSSGYNDNVAFSSVLVAAPTCMYIDPATDILYLCDGNYNRMRKITSFAASVTGAISSSFTVTSLFAGNGGFYLTGDNGPATSAMIGDVTAMYLQGSTQDLYIADDSNYRIRRISLSTGIITTIFGASLMGVSGFSGDSGPASSAMLASPQGIVGDSTGMNLYISDTTNHRIRKISLSTMIITTIAGTGAVPSLPSMSSVLNDNGPGISALLYSPFGLVTYYNNGLNSGNTFLLGTTGETSLYIADTSNNRIRRLSLSSGIITTILGNGLASLSGDGSFVINAAATTATSLVGPRGIWITTVGTYSSNGSPSLYIADSGNHRIRRLDCTTSLLSTIAGKGYRSVAYFNGDGNQATASYTFLYNPKGLIVSPLNDYLYFADIVNQRIRRINIATKIITTVAGNGYCCSITNNVVATSSMLSDPIGMTIDLESGNYFVTHNYYIRMISLNTGIITTVAGNGGSTYNGDGILATTATLNQPRSISFSSMFTVDFATSSQLYIADTNNYRIRVVDMSTGIINTVVGTGIFGASSDNSPATSTTIGSVYGVFIDDPRKVLYFSESNYNRVKMVDLSTGILSTLAGSGAAGYSVAHEGISSTLASLNVPSGLWIDSMCTYLYIADTSNHRIRRVDLLTRLITTIAGSSTSGFTYLTDESVEIPATSTSVTLNSPDNLFGDSTGQYLYFSDTVNNRVRRLTLATNTISTFAGSGSAGTGSASVIENSVATNSVLYNPTSIVSDPLNQGRLYFVDRQNYRVRMLYDAAYPTGQPTGQPLSMPSGQPSNQPVARPSSQPSRQPNSLPSSQPSGQPSRQPTSQPSTQPSVQPSSQPSRKPSSQPSRQPTTQPSIQPSGKPSCQPTTQPTRQPTVQPTCQPSRQPSVQPTSKPSMQPTRQPTVQPSTQPSTQPSRQPSVQPSTQPSVQPTVQPSTQPSSQPSIQPTCQPTAQPSLQPSRQPSTQPTLQPSEQPSRQPTIQPTVQPSTQPSKQPSSRPSIQPTTQPSSQPINKPTTQPSRQPTIQPSARPSIQPSVQPSSQPTLQPTRQPTMQPSVQPSSQPSIQPSRQPTQQPTKQPSYQPTIQPSSQPTCQPTSQPSILPTIQPSAYPSPQPSSQPSGLPSMQPSKQPTSQPLASPSGQPTGCPSSQPSQRPSLKPTTQPTSKPSNQPSGTPTLQPSIDPTMQPSSQPSICPSTQPSSVPTTQPSEAPTCQPSTSPSARPSVAPSLVPTNSPSSKPSTVPTVQPTLQPSSQPSIQPSRFPSAQPSVSPSCQPSTGPTASPSTEPTASPSVQPSDQPSGQPSSTPTWSPTDQPSSQPSNIPTADPSTVPTTQPTTTPSSLPTVHPSRQPSSQPSAIPNSRPSNQPSNVPTTQPSSMPTASPSSNPTSLPSTSPTTQPSTTPTVRPSSLPTSQPSNWPSCQPSDSPSSQPSSNPSSLPTCQPTATPTSHPSTQPTSQPTVLPSRVPVSQPSSQPTVLPSGQPSVSPTSQPTIRPSSQPTVSPTTQPTNQPSKQPSTQPTSHPTYDPTAIPSIIPSSQPTITPSSQPSCTPSTHPSSQPSISPSTSPTTNPTQKPILSIEAPSILSIQTQALKNSIQVNVTLESDGIVYISVYSKVEALPTSSASIKADSLASSKSSFRTVAFVIDSLLPSETYNIYVVTESPVGKILPYEDVIKHKQTLHTTCCRLVTWSNSLSTVIQGQDAFEFMSFSLLPSPTESVSLMLTMESINATDDFTSQLVPNALQVPYYPGSADILTFKVSLSRIAVPGDYVIRSTIPERLQSVYSFVNGATSFVSKLKVVSELTPLPAPLFHKAMFSSDGSYATLIFDRDSNRGGVTSSFICSALFQFPCAQSSRCLWIDSKTVNIYVHNKDYCAAPGSQLSLTNGVQIRAACSGTTFSAISSCSSWPTMDVSSSIVTFAAPDIADHPKIIFSIPSKLSACASLVVDISLSTGHGGRNWKSSNFSLSILDISGLSIANTTSLIEHLGSEFTISPPLRIESSQLLADSMYLFSITLCNFLGKCSEGRASTWISSSAVLSVMIAGANTRSMTPAESLSLSAIGSITQCGTVFGMQQIRYQWIAYDTQSESAIAITSVSKDPSKLILGSNYFNPNTNYRIIVTANFNDQQISSFVNIAVGSGALQLLWVGGNAGRNVRAGSTLVLDASNSYDEDIKGFTGLEAGLTYSWSCVQVEPMLNASCANVLMSTSFVKASTERVVLVSKDDATGTKLQVSLVITSKYGKSRSVTSSITVTILPPLASIMTLTSNIPMVSGKLNVDKQLQITSKVVVPGNVNGELKWTVEDSDVYDLSSISLTTITKTIVSSSESQTIVFNLVVNKNSLTGGTTYKFKLSSNLNDPGVSTSSAISILMNAPPQPGNFLVTPRQGQELSDSFLFSASNWQDVDLPLMYQFGYWSQSQILLIGRSKLELASASLVLPAGASVKNYSVTCAVDVFDSLSAKFQISDTIVVNPVSVLSSADLKSFLGVSLSNLRNTTDLDSIKQGMMVGSYLLNRADCSFAPDCSALNRHDCFATNHTCGVCYSDYIGDSGDRNSLCMSVEDTLSMLGNDQSDMLKQKSCLNDCSGHGECVFLSSSSGNVVDNCALNALDCYAQCICDIGFGGNSCQYTDIQLTERYEFRYQLIMGALQALSLDDTSEGLESVVDSMNEITLRTDEISTDAADSVMNFIDTLLQGSGGVSASSTIEKLFSTIDTIGLVFLNDNIQSARRRLTSSSGSERGVKLLSQLQSLSSAYGTTMVAGQSAVQFSMGTAKLQVISVSNEIKGDEYCGNNISLSLPQSAKEKLLKYPTSTIVVPLCRTDTIDTTIGLMSVSSKLFPNDKFEGDLASLHLTSFPCNTDSCNMQVTLYRNNKSNTTNLSNQNVEREPVTFNCENGFHGIKQHACRDGRNVSVQCNGTTAVVNGYCPETVIVPTCSFFSGLEGTCQMVSYDTDTVTCECSFGKSGQISRKLQSNSSFSDGEISLNLVSMLDAIRGSFVSTIVSSQGLDGDTILKKGGWEAMTVLGSLAAVVLAWMYLAYELDEIEANEIEKFKNGNKGKRGSSNNLADDTKGKTVENALSSKPHENKYFARFVRRIYDWTKLAGKDSSTSTGNAAHWEQLKAITDRNRSRSENNSAALGFLKIAEEALPQVLSSRTMLSKYRGELKRHHRWAAVFFHFTTKFPRLLRVLALATNIITMLFIQSITYNLTHGDDGSCERLHSENSCLEPNSAFATGSSKCYWVVDNEVGSDHGGNCHFIEPDSDLTVIIFVGIFSAVVSTPLAFFADWIIQTYLCPPTMSLAELRKNKKLLKKVSPISSGASQPRKGNDNSAVANIGVLPDNENNDKNGAQSRRKQKAHAFTMISKDLVILRQSEKEFETLQHNIQRYRESIHHDSAALKEFDCKCFALLV